LNCINSLEVKEQVTKNVSAGDNLVWRGFDVLLPEGFSYIVFIITKFCQNETLKEIVLGSELFKVNFFGQRQNKDDYNEKHCKFS
jgi:hypothetical protein